MVIRILILLVGLTVLISFQETSVDNTSPQSDAEAELIEGKTVEEWLAEAERQNAELHAEWEASKGNVEQTLKGLPESIRSRLSLDKMDFSVNPPTGAGDMARADLANGHVFIFTGGMNIYHYYDGAKEHLLEHYEITVLDIADCTAGEYVFSFMDQYNEPVEAWIEQRHGRPYDEIVDEVCGIDRGD
jgi:hypothetical protein